MTIVSATFGLGNEQVVLSPNEDKNIYVAYPYFQSINNPTNKRFVKLWHKTYGNNYPYITDSAVTVWNGWHLWAKAVRKAGTTNRNKVIKALESGITFDSPSGKIKINGPSHHVYQSVHIAVTNSHHGFRIIASKHMVPPSFEIKKCNLIKNPHVDKQFVPKL